MPVGDELQGGRAWVFRHKFLTLLLALLLLFVGYPFVPEFRAAQLVYDALVALVYLTALIAVFTRWHYRAVAVVLGVPAVVGGLLGYVLPGVPRAPLALAFHAVAALFLAFSVVVTLRSIYLKKRITGESVYGAFCGYLLIGLAFGHLYCIVAWFDPEAFRGRDFPDLLAREDARHAVLTYFSFMTLTTVGYGDITPTNPIARNLAWLEAVVGQFYLAVLMAELIGMKVALAVLGQRPGKERDSFG